ncbi:tRNA-splicing endonuclease subunit Sen34 [Diretmus argenteus]
MDEPERPDQHGGEEEEGGASSLPTPPIISISRCGSAPLVWRAADVMAVRRLGLVGAAVGSLPRQPRQNGRLGRPLQLLQEEARLLEETGKAGPEPEPAGPQEAEGGAGHQEVVQQYEEAEGGAGHREMVQQYEEAEGGAGHREMVQQYEEAQERSYKEQSLLALEDRKAALLRAMTDGQTGGSPGGQTTDEAIRVRLEALDQSFTFPCWAMAVQLSTARAGLAYCPETRAFLQASWSTRSQEDQRSQTRYGVFRDLRRRGFYLTSAGKFGGDYLVYPGDPLRFHAHFIAVCLSMDESSSLLDILAVARLGSNVKKTVLLCSPGPGQEGGGEEVVYTSLQWSGMV